MQIIELSAKSCSRACRPIRWIYFLIQVKHTEIPAALPENRFYGGRNPPLLLVFLIFLLKEPEVAGTISFDEMALDHALEDGEGPFFIFAVSPFASGSAADFLTGYKLARPRFKILANLVLIGIHRVTL